jgi:hypothetical protein
VFDCHQYVLGMVCVWQPGGIACARMYICSSFQVDQCARASTLEAWYSLFGFYWTLCVQLMIVSSFLVSSFNHGWLVFVTDTSGKSLSSKRPMRIRKITGKFQKFGKQIFRSNTKYHFFVAFLTLFKIFAKLKCKNGPVTV